MAQQTGDELNCKSHDIGSCKKFCRSSNLLQNPANSLREIHSLLLLRCKIYVFIYVDSTSDVCCTTSTWSCDAPVIYLNKLMFNLASTAKMESYLN